MQIKKNPTELISLNLVRKIKTKIFGQKSINMECEVIIISKSIKQQIHRLVILKRTISSKPIGKIFDSSKGIFETHKILTEAKFSISSHFTLFKHSRFFKTAFKSFI